jgi:peptidoglycan L-alanyl-D-glutamate endopeptidase CwlK
MSAGLDDTLATRTNRIELLAPRFRAAVEAAIAECRANQLDAVVYETYRSAALQATYYARGRTVKPPATPVTNAMSNLYSWHGYGLAVDVIHRTRTWDAGDTWFRAVADVFKRHGCKWGGDWKSPDLPHFQWGLCKPSPSDVARELIRTRGVESVWVAVGAAESLAVIAATTPDSSPAVAPAAP